jgi:hypothetical protein
MGEWRYSSIVFDLDTRRRYVVRYTFRQVAPGTHWIGGGKGPRAGLDGVEWENCLASAGIREQVILHLCKLTKSQRILLKDGVYHFQT